MALIPVKYEDVTDAQWKELADCWWGGVDCERYSCRDPDEAIEDILDNIYPGKITEDLVVDLVAARNVELPENILVHDLERILNYLDEEYGDSEGLDWDPPSKRIKDAWEAFREAVKADYKPWTCEEVFRVEVNALEWAKKNIPEWLEEQEED